MGLLRGSTVGSVCFGQGNIVGIMKSSVYTRNSTFSRAFHCVPRQKTVCPVQDSLYLFIFKPLIVFKISKKHALNGFTGLSWWENNKSGRGTQFFFGPHCGPNWVYCVFSSYTIFWSKPSSGLNNNTITSQWDPSTEPSREYSPIWSTTNLWNVARPRLLGHNIVSSP